MDYEKSRMVPMNLSEAIRKRPGMYIGALDSRGFRYLLLNVLSLLEQPARSTIWVEIYPDYRTCIRANGPGAVSVMSLIQEIQEDKMAHFPGDWDYLGLKTLIAVSRQISIRATCSSSSVVLTGGMGTQTVEKAGPVDGTDMIEIDFALDMDIFHLFPVFYENVCHAIRKHAMFQPTIKYIVRDVRTDELQQNIFEFPRGISHWIDCNIDRSRYSSQFLRMDLETESDGYQYQVSLCYQDVWADSSNIKSYAQGEELILGGSLIDGILSGMMLGINQYISEQGETFKVRKLNIRRSLLLIASVKGSHFDYQGSIKGALNMPRMQKTMRKYMAEQIFHYLDTHPGDAKQLYNITCR